MLWNTTLLPTCSPPWAFLSFADALSVRRRIGRAEGPWPSSATVCGSVDSAVLGSVVTLDGQHYTVVGIAPRRFRLRGDEGDIYTPLGQNTLPLLRDRRPHPIATIARLRPDATSARAESDLAAIGQRLAAQFPATEGRFFDSQDRIGNEAVAVIDIVMAQGAFPNETAVGKHLWIGMGNDPVRVVGVVNHVRYWGPASDDQAQVLAQLYYPFAQVPDRLLRRWSELMSIAVRTSVDPLGIVEPLRREVRGVGNDQVLYELNTMGQLVRDSLERQRFLLLLFGIFAGSALLLACIGIYGVLAYLTA